MEKATALKTTSGPSLEDAPAQELPKRRAQVDTPNTMRLIPLASIRMSKQHFAREFDPDRINELAESLDTVGLIHPVTVRPAGNGAFELIAGARRFHATKLRADQDGRAASILCTIHQCDETMARLVSLEENIRTESLKDSEWDAAVREAVEIKTAIHQRSTFQEAASKKPRAAGRPKSTRAKAIKDVAKSTGKTERTIQDATKRAELIPEAQQALEQKTITKEQGTWLARMEPDTQKKELPRVIKETQTQTKARLKKMAADDEAAAIAACNVDNDSEEPVDPSPLPDVAGGSVAAETRELVQFLERADARFCQFWQRIETVAESGEKTLDLAELLEALKHYAHRATELHENICALVGAAE